MDRPRPSPSHASTSEDAHELVESFARADEAEDPTTSAGPARAPAAAAAGGSGSAAALSPPGRLGRAACKGCGAPIVWIQTAAGRKMPVSPVTISATRGDGAGRLTLIDQMGAVRTRLTFDPHGDILGWEPHWSSCPDAGRFKREQPELPPDLQGGAERGARYRGRRMGLDLHGRAAAAELLGSDHRDPMTTLYDIESGKHPPQMGWPVLEGRLERALRARVAAAIAEGRRWQDLRFPGWSAAEIRDAALLVQGER